MKMAPEMPYSFRGDSLGKNLDLPNDFGDLGEIR